MIIDHLYEGRFMTVIADGKSILRNIYAQTREECEEKLAVLIKIMKTGIQNTYFNEHFGRCDIEPINDRTEMGSAMAYIMKYIEKSGEKIVYSRGLPQYFKSDILDDDVVCPIGMEDQKLLLFDNFSCFEDGVYIGEVSPEVIKQMKKAN